MDHVYIHRIGLFLVLVDAFTGWSETVPDISSKQPEREYSDTPTGSSPLQSQSDTPMEASLW